MDRSSYIKPLLFEKKNALLASGANQIFKILVRVHTCLINIESLFAKLISINPHLTRIVSVSNQSTDQRRQQQQQLFGPSNKGTVALPTMLAYALVTHATSECATGHQARCRAERISPLTSSPSWATRGRPAWRARGRRRRRRRRGAATAA